MSNNLSDSFYYFLDESLIYVWVYSAYALVISGIVLFIEYRAQNENVDFISLFIVNGLHWFMAIALVGLSLFLTSWYTSLFGGEKLTIIMTTLISFTALLSFKLFMIKVFSLSITSPVLDSVISSLVLLLPIIAFHLFVSALGSGFRN